MVVISMTKITIDSINEYLVYKRNMGYKYEFTEECLKLYLKNIGEDLNDDNINLWLSNTKLAPTYIRRLAVSINGYIKYLITVKDITEIKPLDMKKYRCSDNYIPRIYTHNEINNFFEECKNIKSTKNLPYKKEMFTLIYKLAYCCGLRTKEIRHIKVKDINFDKKFIFIKQSKNNINRNIYVDERIIIECQNIINLNNLDYNDYLFCTINKEILKRSIILLNFRTIWLKFDKDANIKTLRVHNLRHSFAVHNLNKWYVNGKDLYNKLPILMTYMGHNDISSTEYYLRMIPEIFPDIINNYEKKFGKIIYWEDTNDEK